MAAPDGPLENEIVFLASNPTWLTAVGVCCAAMALILAFVTWSDLIKGDRAYIALVLTFTLLAGFAISLRRSATRRRRQRTPRPRS